MPRRDDDVVDYRCICGDVSNCICTNVTDSNDCNFDDVVDNRYDGDDVVETDEYNNCDEYDVSSDFDDSVATSSSTKSATSSGIGDRRSLVSQSFRVDGDPGEKRKDAPVGSARSDFDKTASGERSKNGRTDDDVAGGKERRRETRKRDHREVRRRNNSRERSRMRSMNEAFNGLRAVIPSSASDLCRESTRPNGGRTTAEGRGYDGRLNALSVRAVGSDVRRRPSKLATLRQAVRYIGRLVALVQSSERQGWNSCFVDEDSAGKQNSI